jgi:hypothetical protein
MYILLVARFLFCLLRDLRGFFYFIQLHILFSDPLNVLLSILIGSSLPLPDNWRPRATTSDLLKTSSLDRPVKPSRHSRAISMSALPRQCPHFPSFFRLAAHAHHPRC